MDLLSLTFLYCLTSAHQCVDVDYGKTLRSWEECKPLGAAGDPAFQAEHPEWKLRNFTCALMPTTEL